MMNSTTYINDTEILSKWLTEHPGVAASIPMLLKSVANSELPYGHFRYDQIWMADTEALRSTETVEWSPALCRTLFSGSGASEPPTGPIKHSNLQSPSESKPE